MDLPAGGGISLLAQGQIGFQFLSHHARKRDQAFFVEFRPPKRERIFLEIHVLDLQVECLAHPQAAGVDEQDHGRQSRSQQGIGVFELLGFFQDLMNLMKRVDIGLVGPCLQITNAQGRVILGQPHADQIPEESPGKAQFFILGARSARDSMDSIDHKTLAELPDGIDVAEGDVAIKISSGVWVGKTRVPKMLPQFQVGS